MDLPELLQRRKHKNSQPNNRQDEFHIALILESGGLRAAAVGGMVDTLDSLGLTSCIDSVHGSSAGACAGAYLVSGQAKFGKDIFLKHLTAPAVINKLRLLTSPSIVDVDYIVDTVMKSLSPLDVYKISKSELPLSISTTLVESGQACVFRIFSDPQAIFDILRATLRIPGIAEPGILLNGRRHLDGGISAPIPIASALEAGATHILVFSSQRHVDVNGEAHALEKFWNAGEELYLRMLYGTNLAAAYARSRNRFDQLRTLKNEIPGRVGVVMRPETSPKSSVFEKEEQVVRQVWHDGQRAAASYFSTALRSAPLTLP